MAEVTRAIRRMPPRMTRPSRHANSAPVIQVGMPKDELRPAAMLLLCGMLPEPRVLKIVATAKNTASHFMFRARSI